MRSVPLFRNPARSVMRRFFFAFAVLLALPASSQGQDLISDPDVRAGVSYGLGISLDESGLDSTTPLARAYGAELSIFTVSLPTGTLGAAFSARRFVFDHDNFTVYEHAYLLGPAFRVAPIQNVELGLSVQGGGLRRSSVSNPGNDVRTFGLAQVKGTAGIRYDRFLFEVGIGQGVQIGEANVTCPSIPGACDYDPEVGIVGGYTALSLGVSYTLLD